MNLLQDGIREWHERFAASVRGRDFDAGRNLFAPHVKGFGTVVEFAANRRDLEQEQWSRVWPHTAGFRFLPSPVEVLPSADDSQVCVLTLWESEGIRPDGSRFHRRGRCTTVLRRDASTACGWVAVHTHYSKSPDGAL